MRKFSWKSVIIIIGVLMMTVVGIFVFLQLAESGNSYKNNAGTDAAIVNYKKDVDKFAKIYHLPSSYLMALIMLESSGRKNIKPRYEKHVYLKLQKFRDGKITKFEDLSRDDVKNLSDNELKKLAKSYGPFQIMGYKAIKLGVDVSELEGKNAIAVGVKWINNEYGNLLRNGQFKDAFHIHNTGRSFPQSGKSETYDPEYVENGLYYIRYFSNLD